MANGKGHAVISATHVEIVGQYNWRISPGPRTNYAQTSIPSPGGKQTVLKLHQLVGQILGFDPALQVDHINHDGLDCRDDNMRPATRRQNALNRRLRSDNTSGVKGVAWHEREQKWVAQLNVDGKHLHLGYFTDVSAAEAVVMGARTRLHADFACNG